MELIVAAAVSLSACVGESNGGLRDAATGTGDLAASDLMAEDPSGRQDSATGDLGPHAPDNGAAADATTKADLGAPCAGVTCSSHGTCKVDPSTGQAFCECELYYKAVGLSCIPACDGVSCPQGQTCIPGHHDTTDPICVDTCDCSNCGNCAMADFQPYGVNYCGSPAGAPATVVCNSPCPSGQGCIPFSTPICWPGQGCISM